MSQDLSSSNVAVATSSADSPPAHAQKRVKRGITTGWTWYLAYSILAAVLGTAFMYGYNSCVVNETYNVIGQFVNESSYRSDGEWLSTVRLNAMWSVVVSLFIFGGIIGSVWIPDAMANRFGRTRSLIYIAMIGIVGGIMSFISPYCGSHIPLMIGRVLVGFHSGIVMVILPALLVELPPIHLRGACGSLSEFTIVVGTFGADLVALQYLLGTEELWALLFLLAAIFYVVHGVMLFFAAESPRWLIDQKREGEALVILRKLRGRHCDEAEILDEFNETKAISEEEAALKRVSILDFFRSRQLWWPLILAINLHLSQQFTGIGAILFYSSEVMTNAGLDEDTAKLATLGISFFDIFAMLLSTLIVDRVGRRPLMLVGLFGLVLSHVFITIVNVYNQYYACIVGLGITSFTYSTGPGPIAWFMTAEMFPQAARPMTLSICLVANWSSNLAVGLLFPHMTEYLDDYAFLPFAVFSFIELVFFFAFLPETKGIPLDEVVAKFEPGQPFFQFNLGRKSAKATPEKQAETLELGLVYAIPTKPLGQTVENVTKKHPNEGDEAYF